jgi:hypothetical protein
MPALKSDLVAGIAEVLGIAPPPMSTGSTEPKSILISVNELLGLGHDPSLSKPKLAEAICWSAGLDWDSSCWSSGSTVTCEGLRRVGLAACALTGDRAHAPLFLTTWRQDRYGRFDAGE